MGPEIQECKENFTPCLETQPLQLAEENSKNTTETQEQPTVLESKKLQKPENLNSIAKDLEDLNKSIKDYEETLLSEEEAFKKLEETDKELLIEPLKVTSFYIVPPPSTDSITFTFTNPESQNPLSATTTTVVEDVEKINEKKLTTEMEKDLIRASEIYKSLAGIKPISPKTKESDNKYKKSIDRTLDSENDENESDTFRLSRYDKSTKRIVQDQMGEDLTKKIKDKTSPRSKDIFSAFREKSFNDHCAEFENLHSEQLTKISGYLELAMGDRYNPEEIRDITLNVLMLNDLFEATASSRKSKVEYANCMICFAETKEEYQEGQRYFCTMCKHALKLTQELTETEKANSKSFEKFESLEPGHYYSHKTPNIKYDKTGDVVFNRYVTPSEVSNLPFFIKKSL